MNAKTILVVMQREQHPRDVLNKVVDLCAGRQVKVHLMQTVYEAVVDKKFGHDVDGTRLERVIVEAEHRWLRDLEHDYRAKFAELSCNTVWCQRRYQGEIQAARDVRADLIVKGAQHSNPLIEAVRAPDDWHLLREAHVPVMLLKAARWVRKPHILAAVDVFDEHHAELNNRIVAEASALTSQLGGQLHLLTAFPSYQRWEDELSVGYNYERVRMNIEKGAQTRQQALLAAARVQATVHALEGDPAGCVNHLAEQLPAEVIVLGNRARKGIAAMVIGNSAESILQLTARDVLVIPEHDARA